MSEQTFMLNEGSGRARQPVLRNGQPVVNPNGNSVYFYPMNIESSRQTLMMAEESGRWPRPQQPPRPLPQRPSVQSRMMSTSSGRTSSHFPHYPSSMDVLGGETERLGGPLPFAEARPQMIAAESGRVPPAFDGGGGVVDTDCAHPRVQCDSCRQLIGNGVRYKCLDCKDFDLCERCEATTSTRHFYGMHVFCKIRDSRRIDANSYLRK